MDARTAADLEQITRGLLDDTGTTRPRWSSVEIRRALSEAEREACVRARLICDSTTASIVTRAVEAERSTLLLHPSVFEVDAVRRSSDGEDVTEVDEQTMRLSDSRWRETTGSQIEHFLVQVLPSERIQLRLYPIPTVAETLELRVYRTPRNEIEDDDDEPEIAPRHHDLLVDWALYRCFNKRDPDTYDPVKASDHLAAFTANFGERPDANVQRKQRENLRHVVTARDY